MAACQTACIASCCGLDAFEIDANRIGRWAQEEPAGVLEEAVRQVEELIKSLSSLSGESFSRQLRFYGNSDDWAGMLCEWRDAIRAAMDIAVENNN